MLALALDFLVGTLFTMTLSIVALCFKAKIRTALQDFLGIDKKEKLHVLRHK